MPAIPIQIDENIRKKKVVLYGVDVGEDMGRGVNTDKCKIPVLSLISQFQTFYLAEIISRSRVRTNSPPGEACTIFENFSS